MPHVELIYMRKFKGKEVSGMAHSSANSLLQRELLDTIKGLRTTIESLQATIEDLRKRWRKVRNESAWRRKKLMS